MNIFEACVITSIPVGAIIGASLGKSYGIFVKIGATLAGGIVGSFAGWIYGFLIIFFMSVVGVLWTAVNKSEPLYENEKASKDATRNGAKTGIIGIIGAAILGFLTGWHYGIIFLISWAMFGAFLTVLSGYFTKS
jgi:hypothetical protein